MSDSHSEQDSRDIARTLDGDLAGFRSLVQRYQAGAFTVALGIVKDRGLAEDVLQDAFVRAFKGLRRFRKEAAFASWLHVIVVRQALDAVERRSRRREISGPNDPVSTVAAADADPTQRSDRSHYLRLALGKLNDDERLLLQLFYLNELNLKEIQRATRFTPAKIRVGLHRGRKNLNAELDRILGEEKTDLL